MGAHVAEQRARRSSELPVEHQLPGRDGGKAPGHAPQRLEGESDPVVTYGGPDLICATCGEPIRGDAYARTHGGAVHAVGCSFHESCPACHQDLWKDGSLLMGDEFWHVGCGSPTETPPRVDMPRTPPPRA
jgi:hypothetical protein